MLAKIFFALVSVFVIYPVFWTGLFCICIFIDKLRDPFPNGSEGGFRLYVGKLPFIGGTIEIAPPSVFTIIFLFFGAFIFLSGLYFLLFSSYPFMD